MGLAENKKDGLALLSFRKKNREEQKGIIDNFHIMAKIDANIRNQNKKLSVLCTCFIPEYDLLMISSTNNTITAWKFSRVEIKNVNVTSEYKLSKDELKIAILIAGSPQCSMVWEPIQKYLYTGQKDGKILKWELTNPNPLYEDTLNIATVTEKLGKNNINKKDNQNKEENKKLLQKLKEKSIRFKDSVNNPFIMEDKNKNLTVSCLLVLKKLQLLAASYYNGYIILWDTIFKEHRKCYCDQNSGIYSMTYDSIKNLLFTCGFNHDIYVYDPYIDSASIYKLSGHSCSINSIDINEKEGELISLDILGNIKIWDTSGLINFQTIRICEEIDDNGKKSHQDNSKKKKLSSNLKMVYLRKIKKIFIYGNQLLCFETDRSNCPELADDEVICGCYYDKTTKNLLSFCLRKIKFWNLLTGKVSQIYDDPMGAEMTAIAVDKPCKRAYMGDNNGRLRNINLKNGTLLKDLEPHNSEIKFLIHSMELNLIATCSLDNVIKIHDDHELLESEVLKELKIPDFNVRAICLINRFSRLGIGLSNGVVKFYDIEHFHYDSDLESDSSLLNDEVSAIDQIEEIELVLCCYSSGLCKFIVTPPSSAKFNSIYQFNNSKKGTQISISCLAFDTNLHHAFIGDMQGNINCYDISSIYDIMEEITSQEDVDRDFEIEPIISKENLHLFNDLAIKHLWAVEAHKESIRQMHFVDIRPRIIVTTSHDFRIKIFGADDGKYKDEFKQMANRVKPVPIGIKYYLLDPFGEENRVGEPLYLSRKDIENFNPALGQEGPSNQQISEVAKKITEYNAKEKLWLACRNSNLPYNMSNDWKLDIDIEKVQEKEEEEYLEMLETVAEIEKITNATEIILQSRSIYSEAYRPKYIEEMNDIEKIKELSAMIQDRLRNVKLAVSKANLNQSKMVDLTKKNKKDNIKNQRSNYNISKIKQKTGEKLAPVILTKSKSAANIFTNKSVEKDKDKDKEVSIMNNNTTIIDINLNNSSNANNMNNNVSNSINNIVNTLQQQQVTQQDSEITRTNMNVTTNIVGLKKNLLPKKISLPKIKSRYAVNKEKFETPGEMFTKLQGDFDQGIKELINPIKLLFKKSKEAKQQIIRSRSTIILPGFRHKKKTMDSDEDREREIERIKHRHIQHKKNITILEKYLSQLEQKVS